MRILFFLLACRGCGSHFQLSSTRHVVAFEITTIRAVTQDWMFLPQHDVAMAEAGAITPETRAFWVFLEEAVPHNAPDRETEQVSRRLRM
jgi:hypothetical protein